MRTLFGRMRTGQCTSTSAALSTCGMVLVLCFYELLTLLYLSKHSTVVCTLLLKHAQLPRDDV